MVDLLFTAPFEFLPPLNELGCNVSHRAVEAWTPDDLPADEGFKLWVPNPGQHFVVDAAILDRYPALTAISTPSTGTNHIDVVAARKRRIEVTSLLDNRPSLDQIAASAEFTFLSVLNALRRIDVGYNAISRGEWRDNEAEFRGRELQDRRVGLVGLGRIGQRLARYFSAFGCSVSGYDPSPHVVQDVVRLASVNELFESCDIVVVCCILNETTREMIKAEHLRCLPAGAVIANTSRGEVLAEAEICRVLQERDDLLFVGDVVQGEVTGTHLDSGLVKLHQQGRALITPHIAGATYESQLRAAKTAIRALLPETQG